MENGADLKAALDAVHEQQKKLDTEPIASSRDSTVATYIASSIAARQDARDSILGESVVLLGRAVLRLDNSTSRLAWVNIALTIVVVLIGILQVFLMVKGH
jgi:hypothetical protein